MAEESKADHGTGAIARRAGVVLFGTFGSRILGAVRDATVASFFQVAATDTFYVAWTIPNTLRSLLAEGAVSAAFIPTFAGITERRGKADARRYFAGFAGTMGLILLLVAALGVLAAPLWASMYGAGYQRDPQRFALLVDLTRTLFPYIAFAGVAALGMGALNALGHFAVPALAPALLNVAMIAGALVALPLASQLGMQAIHVLAMAALVGGALQVVVQLPALRRRGMLPAPRPTLKDPDVRRSLGLMLPLLLGTGIYQVNVLLGRLFASYLPAGSQSYLYYGQRVVEIPQGMFAVAIASAALPSLAALHERGEQDRAKDTLAFSVRLSLFVSVPAAAAIACLAEPVVCVIFGRGAFDADAVAQTARSLWVMALSVWAVASIHPLVRMFHAQGDTRTPVLCSGLNLVTFAGVSLAFMGSLDHVAIALGNTAATLVQLVALLVLLQRKQGDIRLREMGLAFLRNAVAACVMGGAVYAVAGLGQWQEGGNAPRNLAVFALCVVLGVAVYLGVAYLLRSPELRELLAALRRRRAKAP